MNSVVLLGDSIFDNGAYTGGGPDVAAHLREALGAGWQVTLCALDGAMVADVPRQLRSVPRDATHLLVSMGGNDAISSADLLDRRVKSTAEALRLFGARMNEFEQEYGRALDAVADRGLPTAVCTIYNGDLGGAEAELGRVALTFFNDVILRQAFVRGLDVVDLRLVCTQAADYTQAIEPSASGGKKIAQALARALLSGTERPRTAVF